MATTCNVANFFDNTGAPDDFVDKIEAIRSFVNRFLDTKKTIVLVSVSICVDRWPCCKHLLRVI